MSRHVVKMLCHHGHIFKPHSKIMIRCCWGGRRKRARARLGHGTTGYLPASTAGGLGRNNQTADEETKKRRRERQIDRETLRKKKRRRQWSPRYPTPKYRKERKKKWTKIWWINAGHKSKIASVAMDVIEMLMTMLLLQPKVAPLTTLQSGFCICRSITRQSSL